MIPKLHISIDGVSGIDYIPVATNQPVQFLCRASAARPKSHISWLINNLSIESLEELNGTIFYIEREDETIDTVSTIWYRPLDVNGSITCASHFHSTGETARTHATYVTYGKTVVMEHRYYNSA